MSQPRVKLISAAAFAGFVCAALGVFAARLPAQTDDIRVTFQEPKVEVAEIVRPVDTNQRIQFQYVGMMSFGLTVDQKYLCCGAGAIRTNFKIDNAIVYPNNVGNQAKALTPDRFGRVRPGMEASLVSGSIHITQRLEVIPSKPAPGQPKRPLDNMLIRYIIENKDTKPHTVGTRVRIDTMCGNNDGALFAAPTRPGEILNGVELSGKTLPDYVQILEVPNLKAPGFNGHFTLKLPGNRITPDRFLCTSHAVGDNGWDAAPIAANGDSDCVLFWTPRVIRPGEKVEMAYAYGQGIASLPESEGRLKVSLGGNFEPGKIFTVQAFVEEPVLGQALTLELPPGMTLVEGSPTQPAAPPSDAQGASATLWKGRVDRLGEFVIRVRSSNGMTETRTINVARAEK
jgi:hypothetical protein